MQFVVLGYDGTDAGAPRRRMAARDAHLRTAKEMYDEGTLLYAAALENDDGVMIGSMIVCDFPSRTELEEQWLKTEPYVVGNVWERYTVSRAKVAPFCAEPR